MCIYRLTNNIYAWLKLSGVHKKIHLIHKQMIVLFSVYPNSYPCWPKVKVKDHCYFRHQPRYITTNMESLETLMLFTKFHCPNYLVLQKAFIIYGNVSYFRWKEQVFLPPTYCSSMYKWILCKVHAEQFLLFETSNSHSYWWRFW